MADASPQTVSLIYQNSEGESRNVLANLTPLGYDDYITDDINVFTGNYELIQFLVLNDQDSILAAAPLSGSTKAASVSSSLPYAFSVTKNCSITVEPDIVTYIASDTPELYGYSSSSVNVIGLYDDFANSINHFSFDMFRELIKDNDGNIFISPVSMAYAFGLLYPGSRTYTTEEIRNVFYLNNFTDEELYQLYKDFGDYLINLDDGVTFSLAHAFWYAPEYQPMSSYLSILTSYFDTEVSALDFNDVSNAADVINDWASDNTNGKIKKVVEESDVTDLIAALANATYFKGNWLNGFDAKDTRNEVFYTNWNGSDSVSCQMMHGGTEEEPWGMDYYRNEDIQLVRIPFKTNSCYEMICVMPKDKSCDELLADLDGDQWNTWMESSSCRELILNMPKFEESFKYYLKDPLKDLGMQTMFTEPDLSGMFSNINNLAIDDVIQGTFISVDETGAEAAAVTVIGVYVTSAPSVIELTLDHPFIYAIQDAETHAIIFIGKMMSPFPLEKD
jgi:serpin B